MRRAFQIRLAQLEKRYQRQLQMEQRRNSTRAVPSNVQLRAQRMGISHHRRSSWHSCLPDSDTDDPTQDENQRCGSSQGFDSDVEVSDSESIPTDQSNERIVSRDLYRGNVVGMSNPRDWGVLGFQENLNPLERAQSLNVTPQTMYGGLKGGTRMWNVEPGNGARAGPISPVQDTFTEGAGEGLLPPQATALVNEKVSKHRAKILHYFQQVRIMHSSQSFS